MNQTFLKLLLVGLGTLAMTCTLSACSHSSKKDETVHIDTATNGTDAVSNDGFVETSQAGEPTKTLFLRVGGMKTLTDFSNKFVDELAHSPQIATNPKMKAAFTKGQTRFKDQLAIQLCELADGPCKYKGKNMKDAHEGLGITQAQWSVMGKIFIKALRDVGVQKNERVELANRVARFKNDVISANAISDTP